MKKIYLFVWIFIETVISARTYCFYEIKDPVNKITFKDFIDEAKSYLPEKMKDMLIEKKITLHLIFKPLNLKDKKFHKWGYVDKHSHTIVLDESLKLKNNKAKAMQTIIHETAHIFENIFFTNKMKQNYTQFFNFHKKKQVNKYSPDLYEFENISEHFAVNLEYYALDPDYIKKRPSHYFYLQAIVGKTKFNINPNIEIFTKVPFTNNTGFFDLSPQNIKNIYYAYAYRGKNTGSQLGHSMLVFEKKQHHKKRSDNMMFISYAANNPTSNVNPLKGILGHYLNTAFVLTYDEVVNEYQILQDRSVDFYKVKANEDQKKLIIFKVIEDIWNSHDSYKFLTNNCATKVADIFEPIFHKKFPWKTPKKIADTLIKHELGTKIPDLTLLNLKSMIHNNKHHISKKNLKKIIQSNKIKRKLIYFKILQTPTKKHLESIYLYRKFIQIESVLEKKEDLNRQKKSLKLITNDSHCKNNKDFFLHLQKIYEETINLNLFRQQISYGIPTLFDFNKRNKLIEILEQRIATLIKQVVQKHETYKQSNIEWLTTGLLNKYLPDNNSLSVNCKHM